MSNAEPPGPPNDPHPEDLIEDVDAPSGDLGYIIREVNPAPEFAPEVVDVKPTHNQKVQKQLANGIIFCVLAVYLSLVGFYLFDFHNSGDRLADSFNFALSGLQTLAAAVVGFYYGSRQS